MTRRRNRVVLRSEQRAPPASGATSRQRVAAPFPKCMSATYQQQPTASEIDQQPGQGSGEQGPELS